MTPAATRAAIPSSGVAVRVPALLIFAAAFVNRMSRYLTLLPETVFHQ